MFTVNTGFKLSAVGVLSLCLSQSVDANIWQSKFTQTLAFEQVKSEITAAASVNEAQDIAVTSINQALEAVENAQYFEPFNDRLDNARNTLIQTRSRILLAGSQQQVNQLFSDMMVAGLDSDNPVKVDIANTRCHYSTGEVIAIVVGLILGIIPGLILLVVLC